jgi:hypothetical protein
MSRFKRDNISGIDYGSTNIIARIFLTPGLIIQWFLYIFGGFTKTYTSFRVATRISRSPIFAYLLAFVFWVGLYTWAFPDQMTNLFIRALVFYNELITMFNSPT